MKINWNLLALSVLLSGRPKKIKTTPEQNTAGCVFALVIGAIVLMCLIPCLIPVFVGVALMYFGDMFLRSVWGIEDEYVGNLYGTQICRQTPVASIGWLILTGMEILVSFIILVIHMFTHDELPALLASVVIYVILSVIILCCRYSKIKKDRMNSKPSSKIKTNIKVTDDTEITIIGSTDDTDILLLKNITPCGEESETIEIPKALFDEKPWESQSVDEVWAYPVSDEPKRKGRKKSSSVTVKPWHENVPPPEKPVYKRDKKPWDE